MKLTLSLGILSGVLGAVILAQDRDTQRAESSVSESYAALAGITEVTLAVELTGKGAPLNLAEGEIMELASRRLKDANIGLAKSSNGTPPT